MNNKSYFRKSLLLVAIISFFVACGSNENEGENSVGNNLVSAELIEDINASTMLNVLHANGDPTADIAFGYKAVKIIYNTKGQADEDIKASGLLVIPVPSANYIALRKANGEAPFSISMVCDNHGTISKNIDAPSVKEEKNGLPQVSLAVSVTGKAGFASVMPDYIGFGESNNTYHPYILKKASARASLDMIRASVRYMTDNNILFNGQLYLSGYSEGGFVAMALAKEIEENYSDEFTLKGVAPMAGPYDVEGLANIEINASKTTSVPYFLAFLTNAYTNAYDDVSIQDVLVETNASKVNALFDGTKSGTEIHAGLGLTINGGYFTYKANALFQDSFISGYQNNINNSIKNRFIENNVYDWTPKSKFNIIHCSNDLIVPFVMAQKAYDTFKSNGATDVNLTKIDTVTADYGAGESVHGNCGTTAYGAALKWFADIRSGEIK